MLRLVMNTKDMSRSARQFHFKRDELVLIGSLKGSLIIPSHIISKFLIKPNLPGYLDAKRGWRARSLFMNRAVVLF